MSRHDALGQAGCFWAEWAMEGQQLEFHLLGPDLLANPVTRRYE